MRLKKVGKTLLNPGSCVELFSLHIFWLTDEFLQAPTNGRLREWKGWRAAFLLLPRLESRVLRVLRVNSCCEVMW